MGEQPAKTNQNMINLTNEVVQVYNENNWDPFADHTGDPRGTGESNAHFSTALNDKELMQKYGLNTAWSGMIENVGMTNLNERCTMNDLKNALATTIVGMVSDDKKSSWGHATNFKDASYIGVAVDKYNDIHFIIVNDNVTPSQVGDKSKFENNFDLGDSSELQKQADELQNQLTQQQNKVKEDQARC